MRDYAKVRGTTGNCHSPPTTHIKKHVLTRDNRTSWRKRLPRAFVWVVVVVVVVVVVAHYTAVVLYVCSCRVYLGFRVGTGGRHRGARQEGRRRGGLVWRGFEIALNPELVNRQK